MRTERLPRKLPSPGQAADSVWPRVGLLRFSFGPPIEQLAAAQPVPHMVARVEGPRDPLLGSVPVVDDDDVAAVLGAAEEDPPGRAVRHQAQPDLGGLPDRGQDVVGEPLPCVAST